jgi:LysR family glycine cleavage system transcriptional activator
MTQNKLPPLNSLKAFEAAGRLRSFNLAAAELNVSSGAVSRHIQQLEAWLGAPLFIRRHRGVELTEEGAVYLHEASEALSRLALATSRIRSARTHKVVRVNSATSFTLRWLIPKLARFQRLHPDIEVRIQASNEPLEKITTPYDVAIRFGRQAGEGSRAVIFLHGGHMPFCSPKILVEHPIRQVGDLAEHTLLHVALHPGGWAEWLSEAGAPLLEPRHSLTFDDAYMAIQAAIDGLGITMAPTAFVADDVAEGRLVAPFSGPVVPMGRLTAPSNEPTAPASPSLGYHAYLAQGRSDDPAIGQFLDWLQATGQGGLGADTGAPTTGS